MSDDRKKPSEADTAADQVTGQPSQRRRRLVKGALSAPVFLTLQNGAFAANTSNDAKPVTVLADAGDNPVCVFRDGSTSIDHTVGEKIDFGAVPVCANGEFDQNGNLTNLNTYEGADGFLRCNVKDNSNFEGGYIVAGSSGASICP